MTARHRRTGALMLLLTLATAGCASGPAATPGSPSPATPGATAGLADTRWTAGEIAGTAALAAAVPTAAFGADGTLTGSGGCNRFTTRYTVTGTEIRVDEAIGSTMMACASDVMAQESTFLASLAAARSFSVTGDRLTLTNEAGTAVITFAAQSQSLAGSWEVTGYHNGASAIVSPVVGWSPTVTFTDGTLGGKAGCNRILGSYSVDGAGIDVGPVATTQMACTMPGVLEQEVAFTAALESATTFVVEGDVLTLRRADGALAVTASRG